MQNVSRSLILPNCMYLCVNRYDKETVFEQGLIENTTLFSDIHIAMDYDKKIKEPILCIIDIKKMTEDNINNFIINDKFSWKCSNIHPNYIKLFVIDDNCEYAGFIIINKYDKKKCLLVKAGRWGFPKGKRNKNECLLRCAYRELYEETSLRDVNIEIDFDFPMMYELSENGEKSVGLFVAYSLKENDLFSFDPEEIKEVKWFDIDEAFKLLDGVKNRKILLTNVANNINLL
jgi:8-oxo-dGTP pyrophosphatase MutT (NUDIX family)